MWHGLSTTVDTFQLRAVSDKYWCLPGFVLAYLMMHRKILTHFSWRKLLSYLRFLCLSLLHVALSPFPVSLSEHSSQREQNSTASDGTWSQNSWLWTWVSILLSVLKGFPQSEHWQFIPLYIHFCCPQAPTLSTAHWAAPQLCESYIWDNESSMWKILLFLGDCHLRPLKRLRNLLAVTCFLKHVGEHQQWPQVFMWLNRKEGPEKIWWCLMYKMNYKMNLLFIIIFIY